MTDPKRYLVTSALPYANGLKHVGFSVGAGLPIKNGTGMVETSIDTELLMRSEFNENENFIIENSQTKILSDSLIKDIIKGNGNSDIFIPVN